MVLTSPKKIATESPISPEAAQLLQQVQDELDFESKYSEIIDQTLGPPPKALDISDFQENDPTDGWCCKLHCIKIGICNQDAQVYCPGCDNDKYCSECFRKGHLEGEYTRHIAKKISKSV